MYPRSGSVSFFCISEPYVFLWRSYIKENHRLLIIHLPRNPRYKGISPFDALSFPLFFLLNYNIMIIRSLRMALCNDIIIWYISPLEHFIRLDKHWYFQRFCFPCPCLSTVVPFYLILSCFVCILLDYTIWFLSE